MKNKKSRVLQNPTVSWLMLFFLLMTVIISIVACYFAYQQKRGQLLSEMDVQLLQVSNEYQSLTEDFWSIYLPMFEENENAQILTEYFAQGLTEELTPMQKMQLSEVLSHVAVRDENVQWVAVYSANRKVNYIYLPTENVLFVLPEDFAHIEELENKSQPMEIYKEEVVEVGPYRYKGIAIAGGTPGRKTEGSIVAGYNTARLEQMSKRKGSLQTLRFDIVSDELTIFSTNEDFDLPIGDRGYGESCIREINGKEWYIQISDNKLGGEKLSYAVEWGELFRQSNQSTVIILGITLGMAVMAVGVYLLALQSISKEVCVIQEGLNVLGNNQLNYRIENKFNQPELEAIAGAINQMAYSLKENIERTHEYEQRQIKSELQELQAKFNPHFLYNTLEIFRARCYQNGDDETAELIAQTASIFRGFIGAKTFIPMQEELAFGKRYLALFKARYGDKVQVLYDIDTEVLQYGIIRNVFQPLIENYFEHGYNPANEENYILFKGRVKDEETILFTIEDNGFGMESGALQELNLQLRQPIISEEESYGLRNLHQRLNLFYGGDCGLRLCMKDSPGLVIEMVIRRQKYEADDVEKS